MQIGDRVKILTCPGHIWRGDAGTVIAVGSETLTVRKDGDPEDAFPVHDYAEHFEPLPGSTEATGNRGT